MSLRLLVARVALLSLLAGAAVAEEKDEKEILPGHSSHGEFFDEGPRQAAYLMDGMPAVKFPVKTHSPECRAYIEQGVGQLHGFWFFEAERSFRQAHLFDPECATAFWGLAQANIDNEKRATGFIEQAVKLKDKADERERMYIDALSAFIKAGSKKNKERYEAYTKALEQIIYKYPDDVEAKAFLALHLWKGRDASLPVQSYVAVDAVLDQVFRAAPMHPAHHYRIHLWDSERRENAVASSALCGQSAPGIAHMWHMSGHIYSGLKRYQDAVWQQEASARVDHAHMIRDRILPDQIHNFAHNNEWLIRDLIFVGRARDAIDLAKNMCEMPRHPKFNTQAKKGSTHYGRLRLFETLTKFELWDELLALSETPYLEPTNDDGEKLKRQKTIGVARYRRGETAQGDEILADLRKQLEAKKQEQDKAGEEAAAKLKPPMPPPPAPTEEKKEEKKEPAAEVTAKAEDKPEAKACDDEKKAEPTAEEKKAEKKDEKQPDDKAIEKAKAEARKKFDSPIKDLEKTVNELEGEQAVVAGDFKKAWDLLKKAGVNEGYLARIKFQAGETDEAEKAIRKYAENKTNEVLPKAQLVSLLWQLDKKDDAKKEFETLRAWAGAADLNLPAFARLQAIAAELGWPEDWRSPPSAAADVGNRPALDALGPKHWRPTAAPEWSLKNVTDEDVTLAKFKGRPVVLIFFLGNGCLHCAEQLQAFAKVKKDFDDAGIDLVAVSTDDQAGLKQSIAAYGSEPLPIPLVADPTLAVFKRYRAYDDFEKKPLHGTFVIDPQGLLRWQDISFEPFKETKFVLEEAQRLLKLGTP